MTIREKINYLQAIEDTLKFIGDRIEWYMDIVYNEESGEAILDLNGNYVYKVPEIGTDNYKVLTRLGEYK